MAAKPHANQYKPPVFTCVIHYAPGYEKYIADFQQRKIALLRKSLETLTPAQLDQFSEMVEANLLNKSQ